MENGYSFISIHILRLFLKIFFSKFFFYKQKFLYKQNKMDFVHEDLKLAIELSKG